MSVPLKPYHKYTKQELIMLMVKGDGDIIKLRNLVTKLQEEISSLKKPQADDIEKFIIIEHNERDFVLASRSINPSGRMFNFLGRFKSRIKIESICQQLNKGEQE